MTHEINNKNRQLGAPCRAPKNEGRRWDLRGPSNLRALVETLLDLFFFLFHALKFSFEASSRDC